MWFSGDAPVGVTMTPEGVRGIPDPNAARAIFKVASPSILTICLCENLAYNISAIDYLFSIYPLIANVSYLILDTRASDLYTEGIPLSAKFPLSPYRVMRSSRTVTSNPLKDTYTAWVVSISRNQPRSDHRQADFRYLNLMEPGLDPSVLTFASPPIPSSSYTLHCALSWRDNAVVELRGSLDPDPVIVPGFIPRDGAQMFPHLVGDAVKNVWDKMPEAGHFSLVPTSWWRGDPLLLHKSDVYEMYVDRSLGSQNQPYAFSFFMSKVSGKGHPMELFGRKAFCVNPSGNNTCMVVLGKQHMAGVLEVLPILKKSLLRLKNEETGEYMDTDNRKHMDPSSTAFVAGVLPYWRKLW